MIETTRPQFYHKRWFSILFDRRYIRLTAPAWMPHADSLTGIYKDQLLLLIKGKIVYGAIVQANTLLFEDGRDDCPANVVFSKDACFDADCAPQEFISIALDTYALKGVIRTKRELLYLPLPCLRSSWFPLLVLPEKTQYAIILPAKYWCSEMIMEWMDRRAD